MNRNYYNINFGRLATMLLPLRMRQRVIMVFILALTEPLAVLQRRFRRFTQSLETSVNSQVCRMEAMLNDMYDYYERRIYISDTPVDYDSFLVHTRAVNKPIMLAKEKEGEPFMVAIKQGLGSTITDFDVVFPSGYSFSDDELKKLKLIINSNKLASKKYRIVYGQN